MLGESSQCCGVGGVGHLTPSFCFANKEWRLLKGRGGLKIASLSVDGTERMKDGKKKKNER